ncbi:hypothetical protein Ahy_A05g024893 isoform B [Arachis hypogaea]|uniref:Uncharacterized protein n=1 Tax=Arachis hypogaea TaxID=3818 RepID=A0A445D7C2_ARAHY|nr:hypothetical protein Ahy_A05g024893 isoform B [Arachis hypogaea]
MVCALRLTKVVANRSPSTPTQCCRRSRLIVAVQCSVFVESLGAEVKISTLRIKVRSKTTAKKE